MKKSRGFLPQFALSDAREITLRQLLNHTSGLSIEVNRYTLRRPKPGRTNRECAFARCSRAQREILVHQLLLAGTLVEAWTKGTLDSWIHTHLLSPLK
jgi:hypothetical protein